MNTAEFFEELRKRQKKNSIAGKVSGAVASAVNTAKAANSNATEISTADFFSALRERRKQRNKQSEGSTQFEQVITDRFGWDNWREKSDERKAAEAFLERRGYDERSGLDLFSSGTLRNGYQFGDIATGAVLTAGDLTTDVITGVASAGEGLFDLGTYGVAGVLDWFGADDAAEDVKEFAKRGLINEFVENSAARTYEKDSFAGNTLDSVGQGIGNMGFNVAGGWLGKLAGLGAKGVTALTTGLNFGSSMGSGMSEAYNAGATDEEALLYGSIAGASDALTELLFAGLGKQLKKLGIGAGLSSADDMLAKKVSKMFSSQIAKNWAEFGIKAGAEGLEEVLAGIGQAVGKKLTYESDEDWSKIFQDENLLEQFIVGSVTSGFMQSGVIPGTKDGSLIDANKNKKDFITGFDQNEQAVVKKEIENRIAEAEKDGKTLTKKDRAAIEESVSNSIEKGYISTDTIEEALGGEAYEAYKKAVDEQSDLESREKSLSKEYTPLNRMQFMQMTGEQQDRRMELKEQLAEIRSKIKANKDNSTIQKLKAQLSQQVRQKVSGTRLEESYNEAARRSQAFTADLSKYDEKQRAVVQRAIDSGVLNNTNRSHELVDLIAKVSADKDVPFDFINNEKLKESGFALQGKTVNGYLDSSGVKVNVNSQKALNAVVGHEITHVLEGTELYDAMQEAVFEYAKSKGEYDSRLKDITALYEGVDADPVKELTADLIGDYLFTDAEFVNSLAVNNRNLFQKVYDEIKYLCRVVTAGSKEARQLEKVRKTFADAYRTETKNPTADGGTKYSIVALDNGNVYVKASRNIITGTTKADQRKNITDFFNDLLEGNSSLDIQTIEGDVLTLTKTETADKARDDYKTVQGQPVKMTNAEFLVKLRAEAHIDELAEISHKNNRPPVPDGKNHAFAKNGFTYRRAYFEDFDGQYYEITLSIGHNGTVATVYNVGKISKGALPSAKIIAVVGSKALGKTPSTFSLSNTIENVKQQISLSSDNKTQRTPGGIYGKDVALDNGSTIAPWLQKALGTYQGGETQAEGKNAAERKTSEQRGAAQAVAADKSIGAAPSGFDPVSHLQYEYGSLPEGENPVREDSLPKSTTGKDKVSLSARTVKGAEATPDEFVDLLDREVVGGTLSYMPVSNNAITQKAIRNIQNLGWKDALVEWQADVRRGKVSAELSATGALLLNNAAKAGDRTAWLDILHDYQMMGTNAGQAVQALRILKTLNPDDSLYMINRTVKQMVKDLKLKDGIKVDQGLRDRYANAKTKAERDAALDLIAQDIAKQVPSTFAEKVTAIRYLNMLGNFRTQVRNVVGNTAMKGTAWVKNKVAWGLERLAHAVSGGKFNRTKAFHVNRAQREAARADFETVKDMALGDKFMDTSATGELQKAIEKYREILPPLLEQYRRATNWAMDTGDLIFSRSAYASALAGYLKAQGIKGTDYSKIDPAVLDKGRAYAIQEAQEQTFRNSSKFSSWLAKAGRRPGTPAAVKFFTEGLMSFRKTPANILIAAEQYSPLGIINATVNTINAARKGSDVTGAQAVNSWAKALTGSGMFILGMALQNAGALSVPDDDEEKDRFNKMNGQQSYAINLPDGTNFTIDFLSPAAIPMLMGGELMKLMNEDGIDLADIETALLSIADPMVEMSMLQGVNDALDDIQYADSNLGQFAVNTALGYLTQGMTNTLLGQIERSFENERQTTYIDKNSPLPVWFQQWLGKVSAKTPGWDFQQIPYINAWGEEEKTGNTAMEALKNMLSPSYIDQNREDDVSKELNRLNDAQSDENVYPSTPDRTITFAKDGERQENYALSAEEYVELAKKQGQTQRELVEQIIGNKRYQGLTDAEKAKVIRLAYDYARDSARIDVLDADGFNTKWMGEIKGSTADALISHANEELTFEYEHPEKYAVFKAVSDDFTEYQEYTSDLSNIHADKDANGKSINGSRKKKYAAYINELDIDYGAKLILFKSEYLSDNSYNYEIVEYLNSRKDLSTKDIRTILEELDFDVDDNGHITWD